MDTLKFLTEVWSKASSLDTRSLNFGHAVLGLLYAGRVMTKDAGLKRSNGPVHSAHTLALRIPISPKHA